MRVGEKVIWLEHREFGVAEVLSCKDHQVGIAYYSTPEASTRFTVAAALLEEALVPMQSVGFMRNAESWRYLRVLQRIDGSESPHTYWVKFGGQPEHELLQEDQFHVASGAVRPDPIQAVANLSANSPFFFEARSPLAMGMIEQLRLSSALPCLLSSRVEIYDHQVDVARRVLTDPSMRYLLADEVGLGKTIEAGLVLKQTSIDCPAATMVAVVPEALRIQWRLEMDQWFGLRQVRIFTHSELAHGDVKGTWSLAVIDEAHRLVNSEEHFRAASALAEKCQHLLLLSATPALHHDKELMRLLHLLDPERHPLHDQEGFKRRLTQRQAIGREVLALSTAHTKFSVLNTAKRLVRLVPYDSIISQKAKELEEETW